MGPRESLQVMNTIIFKKKKAIHTNPPGVVSFNVVTQERVLSNKEFGDDAFQFVFKQYRQVNQLIIKKKKCLYYSCILITVTIMPFDFVFNKYCYC